MFGSETKVVLGGAAGGSATVMLGALGAQVDQNAPAAEDAVSDAFCARLDDMLAGTPVLKDIAPLWLDAEGVSAQHPVGGRDIGLFTLMGAFDGVASLASGGKIAPNDQSLAVVGGTAVETGVEAGSATLAGEEVALEYRVTNVDTLTDEGWRMVHHHTTSRPRSSRLLPD